MARIAKSSQFFLEKVKEVYFQNSFRFENAFQPNDFSKSLSVYNIKHSPLISESISASINASLGVGKQMYSGTKLRQKRSMQRCALSQHVVMCGPSSYQKKMRTVNCHKKNYMKFYIIMFYIEETLEKNSLFNQIHWLECIIRKTFF